MTTTFAIYVISYLPDDTLTRAKRKQSCFEQLKWFNQSFPDATPLIYCLQNWTDQDVLDMNTHNDQLSVSSMRVDPIGPSKARNLLLREFYASDNDWGFFFDDDAIFSDHMDGRNFLGSWMTSDLVHCLHPLNPMSMPFNKMFNEKKESFENNWMLNRSVHTKGSSFILKNLKKHHHKELYFDETLGICEDTAFGYELVVQGFKVYRINNLVLKEIDRGQSTIFTKENRAELTRAHHNLVRARYGVVAPDGKKGLSGAAVKFFEKYGFEPSKLEIAK